MADKSICSIEGCGKPHLSRGWCSKHYYRWKRSGGPEGSGRAERGSAGRFLREVVLTYEGDECLPWPFQIAWDGRGRIKVRGKKRIVSRVVCEQAHGPAPTPEHEAAHSCGNGHLACVTKNHLRWATPAENRADILLHRISRATV